MDDNEITPVQLSFDFMEDEENERKTDTKQQGQQLRVIRGQREDNPRVD
jgi:hypothetical protein